MFKAIRRTKMFSRLESIFNNLLRFVLDYFISLPHRNNNQIISK